MNRNFWARRRVFVTGHTGFKGSWLVLMLKELGAEVHGFALAPPTEPSMFSLLKIESLCYHTHGDIRDLVSLEACMRAANPEVVIHMAAQPLVRASYDMPIETYAINVMGTVNILDVCRRVPSLNAILVVTTDKCYDNVGWVWGYREIDRLGGADPYSNSKAACELIVDAYRRSFFGFPGAAALGTARAGNVIGGGDFAHDRLVPDAMRAFMSGEALSVRNPMAIRPWQHVIELLVGYLLLTERLYSDPGASEAWNFGPRSEESASVGQVADMLVVAWGHGAAWKQDPRDHPHEAATLKLDSTKARLELGWVPCLSLMDALQLTTNWYRAYDRGDDLVSLSKEQIRRVLV